MLQVEILLHNCVEFLEATLLVQRVLQREKPLHDLDSPKGLALGSFGRGTMKRPSLEREWLDSK